MSGQIDPLTREARVARASQALRLSALLVAFVADMDPLALYRSTKGASAESYWRSLWLYLTRVGLDITETDLADALGRHHSTIAHACKSIEDVRSEHDGADDAIEELIADVKRNFDRVNRIHDALIEGKEKRAKAAKASARRGD